MKVLLILVDGMRPDAIEELNEVKSMLKKSRYSFNAKTVMPSVTLPCHMSLFHSVDPDRHGITTNVFTPQVRPVAGICEQLRRAGKKCAFFYNWEELKDLSRPDSLSYACYISGHTYGYEIANTRVTDEAIRYIASDSPDFVFLYLGRVDADGHNYGWMSEKYMDGIKASWHDIERVTEALPDDYIVIVTADHGGHGRGHGADIPEDMTIPVIIYDKSLKEGTELADVSIKDIAPTITALLGAESASEWEGKNLL